MPPEIYLDHQATAPLDPRVLEVMLPWLERPANASSPHPAGARARDAVESARAHVAALVGAAPTEVVFTSGATEADNIALHGAAEAEQGRFRLAIPATEHPAVLEPAGALARRGADVRMIAVDAEGSPDPVALARAAEGASLISIMAANNEVGTMPDLHEIAQLAHERGALFHTDAAQAAGRIRIDIATQGIDLLSLSGHKLHGPQGIGALVVAQHARRRVRPIVHGGGQEGGLRSGTVFVAGAIGLGEACRLASECLAADAARARSLAERLLNGLRSRIASAELVGPGIHRRLPGNLMVRIPGAPADALIARAPVACSAGSACSSAHNGPSHVLRAIGLHADVADECVRLGTGRFTTEEDVDRAAVALADVALALRGAAAAMSAA